MRFVPNPGAQGLPASNLHVQSNPAGRAVVQLLAVGPGRQGQNQECSATGFLVNDDGYVLTNAHVIKELRECLPKTPEAKVVAKFAPAAADESGAVPQEGVMAPSVSCGLVGLDEVHDLAVMKAERPVRLGEHRSIPYETLNAVEVAPGASVKVTGHPAFAWQAVTEPGHVLSHKKLLLSGRNAPPSEVLILDLRLRRGNSGSPVYLDPGGGVVGVVVAEDPQNSAQSVAVRIRYAIELLDRLGVTWHSPP